MNTDKLKFEIKQIALEMGAKLVGIGSAERLKDAPPSADMNYCLPGAKSCIIWVYPFSFEAIKNYLAKKERISQILIDLLEGGIFVNVGLRTLEATNPRCGFCSFICVSDIKQRKALYDLLQKSGKMFVDEEGKEYIKTKDESGKEIKYYPPLEV